jgi:hypothetical protein
MGKLTAEQKVREYNRGQKAASEGRSRSWSEPWAYPLESDQHYEERREAFNQGYGIIDTTPMSVRRTFYGLMLSRFRPKREPAAADCCRRAISPARLL